MPGSEPLPAAEQKCDFSEFFLASAFNDSEENSQGEGWRVGWWSEEDRVRIVQGDHREVVCQSVGKDHEVVHIRVTVGLVDD